MIFISFNMFEMVATVCLQHLINDHYFCSMHLHLNQIVKTGIKDIRETIGMVHVEMLTLRSLKMGNLVRETVGSYIIL